MGCSEQYAEENDFYSEYTQEGEEAWFHGTIGSFVDLIIKYGVGDVVSYLPENIKFGLLEAIVEED